MKILFVINSGSKKAAGGHYRSLIEVAAKIANECEVLILNYGVKLSPVVESSQLNFVFEEVKNNDIKSAIDIIHSYAKSFKPTHIHAFDFASFYTSRIVAKKNRLPIIVNKCGGNSWGYYASCSVKKM